MELACQSLIGYRDVLNKTAGIRATSPLGKLIAEGKGQGAIDILNGGGVNVAPAAPSSAPTGARYQVGQQYFDEEGQPVNDNNARSPEERTAYERAINKGTSDAATRNKLNFATNLDKTRQAINADDLTRYSGLVGTANYVRDAAQAALGKPSDNWINHNNAITAASLMRDQMRQFYGDSIQPKALKRLDELTNPSTWYRDPKVAQSRWNQLNKILDIETQTYRNKGTSPIKLNGLDYNDKTGQFTTGSNTAKAATNATSTSENVDNGTEDTSVDMNKVLPQLLKINPNYTEKNIRDTAKKHNTTVNDIINQLFQKSVRKQ